jgi:tyrosinase
MANGVRLRKDIYKLDTWDDTVLWYARAIAEMRTRPLNEPTGWRYQAAIHDFDPDDGNGGTTPSRADQDKYWRQCQHGSWFFLPWHRMYLACFEQIVAATIVRLGGPQHWALPFWNYSDAANADAGKLPPAFREPSLPDGTPNPLRVEERRPGANSGRAIAGRRVVDISAALAERRFAGGNVGSSGFGGARTTFSHSGGTPGMLELVPHGSMHVAVGGDREPVGWMSRFNTAALDPLFWLHHANIDRLWSVWRTLQPALLDPTEAAWLNMPFDFHDGAGNPVRFTCAQVADTEAPPLSYRYEDVRTLERRPGVESITVVTERPMAEMVGATQQPIVLQGRPTETRLAIAPPTGPARRGGTESLGPAPDVYLNIENITGHGAPASYAVYLNLPPGADPEEHDDLFVGILPMFGVAEASRGDATHPGSGLTYSLNAGPVIQRLRARPDWDPSDLRITFVPWREGDVPRPALESITATAPIRVGRVSVYYE